MSFIRITVGILLVGAAAWFGACAWLGLSRTREHFSRSAWEAWRPDWPAGFLWGTATSAHQVEGGTLNDWTRFEEQPGRIARGERSGRAVEAWNRFRGDLELLQALGANAARFSIEWSRLEPSEGTWDEAAWTRYTEWVGWMREAGLEPMVTLLHFTLPLWLADRGGVTAADFPERFARFAGEAARRLGGAVDLWCTINEPNIQMHHGYIEGLWPPALCSLELAVQAFAGMLRAHALAARALHEGDPGARVGLVIHLIEFQPASRWLLPDWIAASGAARAFNWAFADGLRSGRLRFRAPGFPSLDEPCPGLAGSADFLGLNYYRRNLVRLDPREPGMVSVRDGPGPKNDLGWEIYPEGLLHLLREAARRCRLPIYVTENGIPDAGGRMRGDYIRAHAWALSRALAEGIDLRGYFHWSLLDNFEWADGFAPRFGLYRVDYETMERRPAGGSETFTELAPRR